MQYYLPPEAHPQPISTVPFTRNQEFVGSDALLDQIHEKASIPGSRIALVGLGGIGKTELALEYCHRIRQQSTNIWVLWVHASSTARYERSLHDLADAVKIPGRWDRNVNIFQLVGNWLQDIRIGKWILVLDDLNDELLRQPSTIGTQNQANSRSDVITKPPLRYLLGSSNGSIIITTRDKSVASNIAHYKNVVEVRPMNMIEALRLLQNQLEIRTESAEMVQLVEELEFMPLAIVQAASYISQRSPRCSVSQYLKMLRKSDRAATSLLFHEAGFIRRDWEAKNSILVTLQISFDHIRRTRQSAADLLSLMSFFDPHGIQEELLLNPRRRRSNYTMCSSKDVVKSSREEDTDNLSISELDHDFEEDITTLRNYSFISTSEKRTIFTMHRLVQLMARAWLKTHGELEQWKEHFIHNLCSNFPTGKFENWARCHMLFAHVQCAVAQSPDKKDSLEEWASLLHEAALFTWTRGNFDESKRMAEEAMNARRKLFGSENEKTLHSLEMLGLAYSLGGQWSMAEKLHVQVIETCKRILGPEHPSTLTSMANLASTYRNQGRWKEAEELELQAIKTRGQKLGAQHPDTLTSMANLASTYGDRGRWKEAEELELRVVKARKEVLGLGHPDTLTSLANLALTYWNQGRWKEAEELGLHALETRKQVLGLYHPSTLTSMANLASTYWNQRRWKEAEELGMQVLETREQVLGSQHPDTLTSMANLASIYGDQGRLKEAEELELRVLTTRKQMLGPEHPDTLTSIANLASTYGDQGRWEEAEELDKQVMETSKQVLGPKHPSTLTSMANLASTYWHQGRWKEAEELGVQVLEARKIVLGSEHPDTLTSMANLASIYVDQGRRKEARDLELRVMETRRHVLGPEHPDTMASMANVAYILTSSDSDEAPM